MAQFLGGMFILKLLPSETISIMSLCDQRKQHEDADVFRLADDDVSVEAGVFLDLALHAAAGAGGDLDGCLHTLDQRVAVVDLLEELVEGRIVNDIGEAAF